MRVDDLRAGLADAGATIAPSAADPIDVRRRATAGRLRAATTAATGALLIAGIVGAANLKTGRSSTVRTAGPAAQSAPDEREQRTNPVALTASPTTSAASPTTTVATLASTIANTTSSAPATTAPPPTPELTFSAARPGDWYYDVTGTRRGGVLGEETFDLHARVTVAAAEGDSQRAETTMGGPLTYTATRHNKARSVELVAVRMWGSLDTEKSFLFDRPVVEISPQDQWGSTTEAGGISTDGTTKLRVTSVVRGFEDVAVRGQNVRAVRADAVLESTGDRNLTIHRSVWWSPQLGLPVKLVEQTTGTTSSGSRVDADVTASLTDTNPAPDPAVGSG